MSDADAALIALAESRVQKAVEIVGRHRLLIARLTLGGHRVSLQTNLLHVFEDNLAIFERHLAFVREAQGSP